jgi:hypothetical protein
MVVEGIGAGEHDEREHALVVEVRGVGGDAQVVAAEPDPDISRSGLMVQVMEVPQGLGVGVLLLGEALARWHAMSPGG